MRWHRVVEYRTQIILGDEEEDEFFIIARKDGNDEFFTIEINNDYVADSDDIPTREFLMELINEQREIENKVNIGLTRRIS